MKGNSPDKTTGQRLLKESNGALPLNIRFNPAHFSVGEGNWCSWREVFKAKNWLIFIIIFALGSLFGISGVGPVLPNYFLGGISFLHHLNPYEVTLQNGPANQFKYSPFFALLFGFLANISPIFLSILVFKILNYILFFTGLLRWQRLTGKSGKATYYFYLALFAVLADLILSLSVNQVNAAIIGLALIGLAEFRDRRFFISGFILMVATVLKVYPLIFLVGLAFLFKKKYWLGAFLGGVFSFSYPIIFVGWEYNLQTHIQWFDLVAHNANGNGVLDIASAFERLNLKDFGLALRALILICSFPIFFVFVPFLRGDKWYFWITFGIAGLLLLSPRTEIFTYVLLAPSYAFLASWCLRSHDKNIKSYLGPFLAFLSLMISMSPFYPGEWWRSEAPCETARVLGALGFWIISGIVLLRVMSGPFQHRFALASSHKRKPG